MLCAFTNIEKKGLIVPFFFILLLLLQALVVAFNRSVAEDYKKLLPPTATVTTLHSLGLEMLQKAKNTTYKVDEYKKDLLGMCFVFLS